LSVELEDVDTDSVAEEALYDGVGVGVNSEEEDSLGKGMDREMVLLADE
jgi:hypothetical protein